MAKLQNRDVKHSFRYSLAGMLQLKCVLCLLFSLALTRAAFGQGENKHVATLSLHPQNPHYFLFHDHALALIGSV